MPDLHDAILRVVDAAGKSLWHALHAATGAGPAGWLRPSSLQKYQKYQNNQNY